MSLDGISRGPLLVRVELPLTFQGPIQIGSGDALSPEADVLCLRDPGGRLWLPGSSIRGALRDWCEREAPLIGVDRAAVERLFGATDAGGGSDRQGRLTVLDAKLGDTEADVAVRDHVRLEPKHGATSRGAKFDGEVAFLPHATVVLQYEGLAAEDAELRLLEHAVTAFRWGLIPLGAKKGWGFGATRCEGPTWSSVDRRAPEGLGQYLSGRLSNAPHEQVLEPLPAPAPRVQAAGVARAKKAPAPFDWLILDLDLQFDGPFIVAGPVGREPTEVEKKVDTTPIRNPDGTYPLPGSSLRGVLRAHAGRIANAVNKPGLVDLLFGPLVGTKLVAGLMRVGDGVTAATQSFRMDHVAIDRMTNFAVESKLFNVAALESPRYATQVVVRWDPKNDDHRCAVALLLFALRDAGEGLLWAGSRTTRGYGHLKCLKVGKAHYWRIDMSGSAWSRPDPEPVKLAVPNNSIADLQGHLDEVLSAWAPKGATA